MYHRTNREYSTIIVIAIALQQDFVSFTKVVRYRYSMYRMKPMTKGAPFEHENIWTVPYRFVGVRKVGSGKIITELTN